MSRSSIFKIFCFLAAIILLTNIISDFRLTEAPYLQIITQFGLMAFLVDIGLHANTKLEDVDQKSTTSNYSFLISKFGLSSALVGFLIQTLSI